MAFSLFGKKPPPSGQRRERRRDAPDGEVGSTSDPVGELLDDNDRPEIEAIVIESQQTLPPVLEQAAMLYANGQDDEALQQLEAAITRDDLGVWAEHAWTMLFDLYGSAGAREAFDEKAVEFSVKFERSPPSWTRSEGGAGGAPASALATLLGELSAASGKHLEPISKILKRAPSVRIDVGKVRAVDAEGAALLLDVVGKARKGRKEIILQNPAALAKLVEAQIEIGRREGEALWLLLFELLQQQGQQEKFEDLALNYAVTFELSPPSWETRGRRPVQAREAAPVSCVLQGEGVIALRGEIAGAVPELQRLVPAQAVGAPRLALDMQQLQRMDFACAGLLLNLLMEAAAHGKPIEVRGASSIVAALLQMVGIGQVATIERRKY